MRIHRLTNTPTFRRRRPCTTRTTNSMPLPFPNIMAPHHGAAETRAVFTLSKRFYQVPYFTDQQRPTRSGPPEKTTYEPKRRRHAER